MQNENGLHLALSEQLRLLNKIRIDCLFPWCACPIARQRGNPSLGILAVLSPFREAPADVLGEGQQLSGVLSLVLQSHRSCAGFLGFSAHAVYSLLSTCELCLLSSGVQSLEVSWHGVWGSPRGRVLAVGCAHQ